MRPEEPEAKTEGTTRKPTRTSRACAGMAIEARSGVKKKKAVTAKVALFRGMPLHHAARGPPPPLR
jgi:hypothetical protein